VKKWIPHDVVDIDHGPKMPAEQMCHEHGLHFGPFCLLCYLEAKQKPSTRHTVPANERASHGTAEFLT